MQKKLSLLKDAYFFFFAILFVVLAIVGGFKNYSSIPFWDMWDGYLDFYTKVSAGDWSSWWAQHNEHRIVLARIFFWLDIRYLHGQGWLLIILNYLLLSFAAAVFVMLGKKMLDQNEDRYLLWFLVAWMFFWSQHENLTWGFQSQFFLAYLLPLISIILLWQSHQSKKSDTLYFILSLLAAIASVGSMANGIIALPLLFVYSLFLKISWRRSFLIFVLSLLCLALYLYGYQAPPGHGSLVTVVKNDFFTLLRYMARYLGSPFASIISDHSFKFIAEILGFFILFFTPYSLVNDYLKEKTKDLNFALLTFVVYVIATSFLTAGGRLLFGLDQAFSGRYTTPAIMVWSVIFLILAQSLRNKRKVMVFVLGFVLICMLPMQLKALKNMNTELTKRRVAALSLALNLEDEDQIKSIFPSAKWGLELSKVPNERGYSIFGYGDIYQLKKFLKSSQRLNIKDSNSCLGNLDVIKKLENNNNYYFISGWIYDKNGSSSLKSLKIFNHSGLPTGVGFFGIKRVDVSKAFGFDELYSGFEGYIKKDLLEQGFLYILIDQGCILKLHTAIKVK
jgi:hypothetical protein